MFSSKYDKAIARQLRGLKGCQEQPTSVGSVEYHCARTGRVSRNTLIDLTPLIEALYTIYTKNKIYWWLHSKSLVTEQNDLPPTRAAY